MIMYQLQKDDKGEVCAVTIVGQNISIPLIEDNTDYQAYLKWLDEGNQPLPAEE